MPRVMIDDLLTQTEPVTAEGHPEPITITFTPCLPAESIEYQVDQRGRETRAKLMHDLILKHVKSWDVEDRDGKVVEVKSENLKRVPEAYWWGMEAIILNSANKVSDAKKN